jgi:hypothetical protein
MPVTVTEDDLQEESDIATQVPLTPAMECMRCMKKNMVATTLVMVREKNLMGPALEIPL